MRACPKPPKKPSDSRETKVVAPTEVKPLYPRETKEKAQ
jgi:hypothetical protein